MWSFALWRNNFKNGASCALGRNGTLIGDRMWRIELYHRRVLTATASARNRVLNPSSRLWIYQKQYKLDIKLWLIENIASNGLYVALSQHLLNIWLTYAREDRHTDRHHDRNISYSCLGQSHYRWTMATVNGDWSVSNVSFVGRIINAMWFCLMSRHATFKQSTQSKRLLTIWQRRTNINVSIWLYADSTWGPEESNQTVKLVFGRSRCERR